MRILTTDNVAYDMTVIPEQIEDLKYCVFDMTDLNQPDYYYSPLFFIESFNAPAIVLKIGDNVVNMPMDWQIVIGEKEFGDLEVVPLTSINGRRFNAFVINPFSSFRPDFYEIEIVDIYQDVRWYFPKLKPNQFLTVPLAENVQSPMCALFIKETTRQIEVIEYSKMW